jgi:hypothetical protein
VCNQVTNADHDQQELWEFMTQKHKVCALDATDVVHLVIGLVPVGLGDECFDTTWQQ